MLELHYIVTEPDKNDIMERKKGHWYKILLDLFFCLQDKTKKFHGYQLFIKRWIVLVFSCVGCVYQKMKNYPLCCVALLITCFPFCTSYVLSFFMIPLDDTINEDTEMWWGLIFSFVYLYVLYFLWCTNHFWCFTFFWC